VQNNSQIRVENLCVSFKTRHGEVFPVDGLSYSIEASETLGIVGESGCGKSVTSLALMKLIDPPGRIQEGAFYLQGQEILQLSEDAIAQVRGKKMAMIFQEPMTALNPVLTIGEQIDEQIIKHEKISAREAKEKSIDSLAKVGIPSPSVRYGQYPHQLSGGMRQRAMIAMALSCKPDFLIADEPTTALDVTIQAQILDLLQELQDQHKMSIQFITHDLGVISEISQRVLVMYAGQACELTTTEELFSHPQHPYTAALIQSRPSFGQSHTKLKTIEGSVPALHELPKGCRFANRCPRAQKKCSEERPELRPINSAQTHWVSCFYPLEA
jgi:peptide/nickel transport system ATP-binding protein